MSLSRSSALKIGFTAAILVVALLLLLPPDVPTIAQENKPPQPFGEAISWLPADTETVLVMNGPLVFAAPEKVTEKTGALEGHKPEGVFLGLLFGMYRANKGLLEKHLKGETLLLGMEGSRHFLAPHSLGMGPYEGCAIAVFASDITGRTNSFMKDASTTALRTELIEGHKVTVFQEKLEEDVWTTFVAFPKPNIVMAATSKEYLQEVLTRLNGKSGERALPDSLPEWRYVNVHAPFWAVRHFDKKGSAEDPTSPFGGEKAGNMPDEQAIGLTFQFDPGRSRTATIRYLSGDPKALKNVKKSLFPIEGEPWTKELRIRYRKLEPGVVEGSFILVRVESVELFVLVLLGLLGHAVYL